MARESKVREHTGPLEHPLKPASALHSSEMPEKAISKCRVLLHTINLERRWALKGIRHINKREARTEDVLSATSTPAGHE